MNKATHILLLTMTMAGTSHFSLAQTAATQQQDTPMNSNEPKVTGIGGIFFTTEDPAKTREWYGEHLGLAIDDYGSPFEFRNANHPDEVNYLRWSAFDKGAEHFKPSKNEFMINYRVQHIDALVDRLKVNGVTVLNEITDYGYGKFVHILDVDGNKVELWEPVDSFFTKMGGATTK